MQGIENKFWRFALPSMLSQLLNSFFIIVDGFFIGQNLGDVGLAAINVAWPLVVVLQASALAIGTGGAVRLATAVGEGDIPKALQVRGNTISMLAVASVVLGTAMLFSYPYLLPLIGANEELYPLAAEYIRVECMMAVFQIFTTGLLPLLRGAGRSITAMVLMVMGLFSNIYLDWLFIHHYHWGLPGAAFATGLSQAMCAVLSLPILLAHKGWALRLSQFKLSGKLVKGILHYGISPFGLSLSTSVIILFANLRALRYGGTGGVAAYAVLSYILGSVIPLITGVGDGIQPLLSNARGAGNLPAMHRLRRKGLLLAVGASLACSVLCQAWRFKLPELFGAGEATSGMVAGAMWTLSVAFPFMAMVRFCCSYFCAVGQPMASSILAYGEPLAAQPFFLLVLPLFMELAGVWVSYPAAVAVMAGIALWLLHRQLHPEEA